MMTTHNREIQTTAKHDCNRWRQCFVAALLVAMPGVVADASGAARFTKDVEVFGLHIYATDTTPDEKLMHAAGVLAQYIDNDEDGQPDNPAIMQALLNGNGAIRMKNTQGEATTGWRPPGQDLYAEATQLDAQARGVFDSAWEEVLHMVSDVGWGGAYPDVFGRAPGTDISNAMDLARGGRFFSVPDEYPEGAWYTYDAESCDYDCMNSEYIYWGLTSILGAQDYPGRLNNIGSEWRLNTREKVEETDPAVYALMTNPAYMLPTILPDGKYFDEVRQHKLAPSATYFTRDTKPTDDLGDFVSITAGGAIVGERDSGLSNDIVRLVVKFELPDVLAGKPVLDSAMLRFFVNKINAPAGPLSLFHSVTDNDLDLLASDYENASYADTLLDLVEPTDVAEQFYELDVTAQVLADYAADGLDPLSAFRFQINEAVFFEDNQSHIYQLLMPSNATPANRPELVLMFTADSQVVVPEPSSFMLAALALLALLAHGHRRRRT